MADGEGILFVPPSSFLHGCFKKHKLQGSAYIKTTYDYAEA
jgi:hypothetical protein